MKKLKELRTEKNMSQAQLAEKIGVTQKAIDFWEKNLFEPKATSICRLADFFAVTTDFLLDRENEAGIIEVVRDEELLPDLGEQRLIAAYRKFDIGKRQVLLAIVDGFLEAGQKVY